MDLREGLQKKVEAKELEIEDLRKRIGEAAAYIQGLQEAMKMLPKGPSIAGGPQPQLRPGTLLYKAKDAINAAGRPMHIAELLKAVGRPVDKNSRAGLAGSIAAYARKGEVFTRTAPNTFGLIGFTAHPPENFGLLQESGDEEESALTQ